MANLATQAGNNGVSGAVDAVSGGSSAIRTSVSQTEGGTYSASDVQSVTKNLRFAYYTSTLECDSPAIDRT
tara:strand:- start:3360 stop:3572 length:213 start_codon:yes stop_codon:yes gene_type:complete